MAPSMMQSVILQCTVLLSAVTAISAFLSLSSERQHRVSTTLQTTFTNHDNNIHQISSPTVVVASDSPPPTSHIISDDVHALVNGIYPKDMNLYNSGGLVHVADQSFRRGIVYEQQGQARKAAYAFHEATIYYQCLFDYSITAAAAIVLENSTSTQPSSSSSSQQQWYSNPFAHVTCLHRIEDIASILVYSCLSLGYLYFDAMDDPTAAIRIYKQVNLIDPSHRFYLSTSVSWDGVGVAMEAAAAATMTATTHHTKFYLMDAIQAYREALVRQPDNSRVQFHLAVALDRCAEEGPSSTAIDATTQLSPKDEASDIFEQLRRSADAMQACLVDTWGYVRWHMRKQLQSTTQIVNLYRGTRAMLQFAVAATIPLLLERKQQFSSNDKDYLENALFCEFGVGSGRTLRLTRDVLPILRTVGTAETSAATEVWDPPILYGFDTFTGLPQAWGDRPVGSYSTDGAIPVEIGERVQFHTGLFRDTITPFLDEVDPDSYLAYVHIDCRLYSSTVDILESMRSKIVPGTILLFSEYIGHPTWRNDEFRALRECCKRFGWKYEYLSFSLSTKQAVVRITDS
jgi:tetratricopeptide (TPR) repeat protein